MSEYGRLPPMCCLVALPSCDGELIPVARYQLTVLPLDEQLVQMDQLGDRSA
jgi:hypothetical protein